MADAQNLITQARMVFRGTVVRLNAATMSEVPLAANTAIVRIDEPIRVPDVVGDLSGQEITVQLQEGTATKEGDEAVFFVNPWLYGESMAALEVGRSTRRTASDQLREQIDTMTSQQDDDGLRQRLADAEAIVSGRVHNVKPLENSGPPPITEHDPDWWEASISVDTLIKGDVATTSVQVLFPHSMDVLWYGAPKLAVGQEGIWLLQRRHVAEIGAMTFAVVDALDAHPKSAEERIRSLMPSSE